MKRRVARLEAPPTFSVPMHIRDIFAARRPTFSFEFFPPKTAEGAEALFTTIRELEAYKPAFVSVTYGAGGTTRDLTHELVVRIKRETSLDPVPHLTCVCHSEADVAAIIDVRRGVSNILALGGDPPKRQGDYDGTGRLPACGGPGGSFVGLEPMGPTPRPWIWHWRRVFRRPSFTPNRLMEMDYPKAKSMPDGLHLHPAVL